MKITISIIIPTHNRPELLKRALQSVLKQTLTPYEVIVVDDVGCAKTKTVVDESTNSDLVRYVYNKNGQGASSSRNLGAETAQGNYVAFLDDDDEWLTDKLQVQSSLILKNNLDACFSQIFVQYENSKTKYKTKASMRKNFHKELLKENFIGATISAVIKKEIFILAGGFDTQLPAREEYDLWIKISKLTDKFGIVEKPLAIAYRSLEGRDRISVNIDSYVQAIERINKKHSSYVDNLLTDKEKKLRIKAQYDFLAAQAITIGLRKPAIKYYLKSLFSRPSIKPLVCLLIGSISPVLLIKLRSKI
jgi:glycosyltransferase involved in cell wall biosynthesis